MNGTILAFVERAWGIQPAPGLSARTKPEVNRGAPGFRVWLAALERVLLHALN